MEAVVCHIITQYTLLPTHLHLQMFIAMSHWSGSRPLASATPSILDPHQGCPRKVCFANVIDIRHLWICRIGCLILVPFLDSFPSVGFSYPASIAEMFISQ